MPCYIEQENLIKYCPTFPRAQGNKVSNRESDHKKNDPHTE